MLDPKRILRDADALQMKRRQTGEHVDSLAFDKRFEVLAEALCAAFNAELEELQRKPEPGSRFVVVYDSE